MINKNKILTMLEYCAKSYKNVQPEVSKSKLICVIDDKKTDVQCYIRKYKTTLYITFRGTNSLKDLTADLTFWKRKIPYNNQTSKIKVHSGFIDTYKDKNIRSKIHCFITDNITKIILSGHSYGAALATLCAVDLEYNFPRKDYEVFLFGSPRVGNRAFKKSYNKRIFKTIRVENGNDLVTKIPFASWGFAHVGIKMHVGLPKIFGLYSLSNHNLQRYYSVIFKNLK